MLQIIKDKLKTYTNRKDRYNYLREYLQLIILDVLDRQGYFRNIAFVGGTALRILYDLKRFSEDLDFSLIDSNNYNANTIADKLTYELGKMNFNTNITCKDKKNVAVINIKFIDLLFQLGLTNNKTQVLLIKMEIDQKPPLGFTTEFTLLNKEFLININHYDQPSLFAGKLHAVLYRKYSKGRDFYDLLWFLAKQVAPNYSLLNAAILQTEKKDLNLNTAKLTVLLSERINKINFDKIRDDVMVFLENSDDARFFTQEHFLTALKNLK